LNADKERIEEPSAAPGDMRSLLVHLQRNSSSLPVALHAWASYDPSSEQHAEREEPTSPSHLLRSNAETGWQFDEQLPALVHPIFHYTHHGEVDKGKLSGQDPVDWVVVLLNVETIQKRILPELMERYFRGDHGLEYKLAVISEGTPSSVLYSSETGFETQDIAASDSVMNIFGPPPQSTEGDLWQAEKNRLSVKGEDWRRFSGPVWFPIIQQTSKGAPWVLVLQNRNGPLDAAVTRVWRSNLAIGGLALLLLSATMVLVVIASQRSQTLANLQMGFVASVSHELNTPLAVILSASENMIDGFVDGKQSLFQHGSIIKRQAHRLKDLVDQILLYASIRNSTSRFMLRPIESSLLVETIREHTERLTEGLAFTIEEQTEGQLPPVMGDLSALSQCLQNLIANAVKYCGANRWIGVRAGVYELDNQRSEVRISIQDRGIGINGAELPHIFKAFYRSPEVVAAQIRGTGLGLAISRHIADGMGGRLSATSEPHVGSTFTLHLPALVKSDDSIA
jgi:signal transduction histidine kinase